MKYKYLFTKKFCNENPRDEYKAQSIAGFIIKLYGSDAEDMINQIAKEDLSEERLVSSEHEAKIIAGLDNAGDVIRYMRKSIDPLNRRAFLNKILLFEEEILPDVIEKIKKSGNDYYIESATQLLSLSENNYSVKLMDIFDDIKNSYAQSMMLVVIGFKGDEEVIPWMFDKYFKYKNSSYDDGDRAQGALIAFDELFDRFYS